MPVHDDDDSPEVEPYSPAAHDVHDVLPVTLLYVPAGHCPEHSDVARPVLAPYLPTGHNVHDDDPVALLYCPTPQIVGTGLPTRQELPAEHTPQADDDVALSYGEYRPTLHRVHTLAPDPLYDPDGHSVGDVLPNGQYDPDGHSPVQFALVIPAKLPK